MVKGNLFEFVITHTRITLPQRDTPEASNYTHSHLSLGCINKESRFCLNKADPEAIKAGPASAACGAGVRPDPSAPHGLGHLSTLSSTMEDLGQLWGAAERSAAIDRVRWRQPCVSLLECSIPPTFHVFTLAEHAIDHSLCSITLSKRNR